MFSYYVIYYEKFRKVMQRKEREAFLFLIHPDCIMNIYFHRKKLHYSVRHYPVAIAFANKILLKMTNVFLPTLSAVMLLSAVHFSEFIQVLDN